MSTRRRLMMQSRGGGGDDWKRYIQDGLVFCVDCADYKDNTDIVDKISGAVFRKVNGNIVKNIDGGILFDGVGYFENRDNLDDIFNYQNHTFEACFENFSELFNLFGCNTRGVGFRFGTYGNHFGDVYGIFIGRTPWNKKTIKRVISIVPGVDQYDNLEFSTALSGNYTSSNIYNYIGKNGGGYRPIFKGVIYNLRIYNRVLSAEERTYNAMIDNERFNLGL